MQMSLTIIILAASLSSGSYRGMCGPSAVLGVVSAGADGLEVNSGGTAKATGVVLENVHACQVDAACYLRLRVEIESSGSHMPLPKAKKHLMSGRLPKKNGTPRKTTMWKPMVGIANTLATQLRPIALIPSMFTF
jgi:hypothetical protein